MILTCVPLRFCRSAWIGEKRWRASIRNAASLIHDTDKTGPSLESRRHGVHFKSMRHSAPPGDWGRKRNPDGLIVDTSVQENTTAPRIVVTALDPITESTFSSFIRWYRAFRRSELHYWLWKVSIKHLWVKVVIRMHFKVMTQLINRPLGQHR